MYIVEGNIGTGKSTFLKLVAEHMPHISVMFEPRHHWQSDDGDSLLKNFYQDPHRWAYTLETLTMICRVREHLTQQANKDPNRIMERSIYSGHYCFAHNDFANGFINSLEWSSYNQWFNFLVPHKCNPPLGFIYLKTTPDVCFKRIQKRNRGSEVDISLEYLQQINDRHEHFLLQKKDVILSLQHVPVLVLECNEEFETNPSMLAHHLEKLQTFLQETQLTSLTKPSQITSQL